MAGNYRLFGLLGEGGMGEVYDARHASIDRPFAVKVLRSIYRDDARAMQRFEREARIVGSLECEQIVAVLDYGKLEDGTPYLAMERLRGDDLKSLLGVAGGLSVERSVAIALDVCQGLQAAHRAGLVHRDLKPANLFLSRGTGREVCKILDFGIAREVDAATSTSSSVVGTARYMAPEQISEGGAVTAAADLYALGAILYECLGGRRLHDGSSIEAVLFSVLHDEPRPLVELAPQLPPALCGIVQRLLRKQAGERYASAAELHAALRGLGLGDLDATRDAEVEPTGSAVSLIVPPRVGAHVRRKLGVALALLATALGGYWLGSVRPRPSALAAPRDAERSVAPVLADPGPAVSVMPCASLPTLRGEASPTPAAPRPQRLKNAPRPAGSSLFVADNPYQAGRK